MQRAQLLGRAQTVHIEVASGASNRSFMKPIESLAKP